MEAWLNDGLLLSTGIIHTKYMYCESDSILLSKYIGKKWHDRRKIITQAFHFNILEKFTETFNRVGNVLIAKLNSHDANESIEFYPISALYALDVICGEFLIF